MIGADDNVLNTSTGKPQQGVEHPSVSNALATAFTLNDFPLSPYLSLKRKEHECEHPPPAPAHLTKNHKPHHPKFREDVSIAPIQILDAKHPALELDIHKLPIYLLHHNVLQSSTYCIYVRHVQHLYTQLCEGLPEMIVEMKGLAVPDDEKEGEPIFPCVLTLLFQERPDIEVALRPNFSFGCMHPKSSSHEGEMKNNFDSSLLSSSEPPLKLPLSSLPAPTDHCTTKRLYSKTAEMISLVVLSACGVDQGKAAQGKDVHEERWIQVHR